MKAPGSLDIRRATGVDALAVAAVHIAAWKVAYRGIVPEEFLESLDVSLRASRYTFDQTGLREPSTWIAVHGDSVDGFATAGPSRDEDLPGQGEVLALYVSPERWRTGVGTLLMERAERQLADDGFTEASLWVLEDNVRGRGFYEATGWTLDGHTKTIDIGGRELIEVRYLKALTKSGA